MATKLYYGYSESAASSAVKEVIISKVEYLVVDGTPIEIEAGRDLFLTRDLNNEFNPEGLPVGEEGENLFDLASGDILIVYFKYNNTNNAPRILLRYKDSAQEENIISDTGNYIRTQAGVNIDKKGLWADGETLIFSYVEFVRVGYWYLMNSSFASENQYGNVKLTNDYQNGPDNAAITKGAAKELFAAASGNELAFIPSTAEQLTEVGTIQLKGMDKTTGEEIVISEIYLEVPKGEVYTNAFFDLDVEVDPVTERAFAGDDMDFYNDLLDNGYDNAITWVV